MVLGNIFDCVWVQVFFAGVLVQDFPKRACQTLIENLRSEHRLAASTTLRSILPKTAGDEPRILKGFMELLLDQSQTHVPAYIQDLRVLLVKELRHELLQSTSPLVGLGRYRNLERTLRLQAASEFLGKVNAIASTYEEEVINRLTAMDSRTAELTITKIFMSNISGDVSEWLGGPEFLSASLQSLLALMLQYQSNLVIFDRTKLELILDDYMLVRQVDRMDTARALFTYIKSPTYLFQDTEKALFLDILELAWDVYYTHSAKMLAALSEEVNGLRTDSWLNDHLIEVGDDAIYSPDINRPFDRYGFMTAFYMARWMQANNFSHLSLLLTNCRLAHLSMPVHQITTSKRVFAVSETYTAIFGPSQRSWDRPVSVVGRGFGRKELMMLHLSAATPSVPSNGQPIPWVLQAVLCSNKHVTGKINPVYATHSQL